MSSKRLVAGVAVLLLSALFFSSVFTRRAEAQVSEETVTPAAAAMLGWGVIAGVISFCMGNIAASLSGLCSGGFSGIFTSCTGVITAIISGLIGIVSALIGIISGIFSACVSGCTGLCSGGILGAISGAGVYILQAIGRLANHLCTGTGGMLLILCSEIIFTSCEYCCGVLSIHGWLFVRFLLGISLGLVGAIFAFVPIASEIVALIGGILYAIWAAVHVLIGTCCIIIPISLRTIIQGGIVAWNNIGWYIPIMDLLDLALLSIVVFAYSAMTMGVSMTGFAAASWIGGGGGLYGWIGEIVLSVFEFFISLAVVCLSCLSFGARIYSIFPALYNWGLNTMCAA